MALMANLSPEGPRNTRALFLGEADLAGEAGKLIEQAVFLLVVDIDEADGDAIV